MRCMFGHEFVVEGLRVRARQVDLHGSLDGSSSCIRYASTNNSSAPKLDCGRRDLGCALWHPGRGDRGAPCSDVHIYWCYPRIEPFSGWWLSRALAMLVAFRIRVVFIKLFMVWRGSALSP